MISKSLFATAAAMGMAFAPIAAQAGTRAGDSTVSLSGLSRQASPMEAFAGLGNDAQICAPRDRAEDNARNRCELILWLGGAAVVIAVLIAISGGSEDDSSFGTGG